MQGNERYLCFMIYCCAAQNYDCLKVDACLALAGLDMTSLKSSIL